MPWGAAIGAGASLLGGIFGGNAASSASKAQADAQKQAIQAQQQQFAQTSGNLAPFLGTGIDANTALANQLGLGGQPPQNSLGPAPTLTGQQTYTGPDFSWLGPVPQYNEPAFTQQQFQSSPGYEFQKQQGIDAIQNSAVGKTGTLSGNTLKALDTFGTGLANQDWWNAYNQYHQNYTNQFNSQSQNYWNQENAAQNLYDKQFSANNQNALNQYNANTQGYQINQGQQNRLLQMLQQMAGAGQNAAVQQGGFGANATNQIGQGLASIGGAQAGGILGQAGATTSAIGGIGNALLSPGGGNNAISQLIASLTGGGGSTASSLANNYPFAMSINNAPYTF